MRPSAQDLPTIAEAPPEEVASASAAPQQVRLGPMDHLAQQKRVSWDELKKNLAEASWREEGVPGSKAFDNYSDKLEKDRTEMLRQQEDDMKRMLKRVNKGGS